MKSNTASPVADCMLLAYGGRSLHSNSIAPISSFLATKSLTTLVSSSVSALLSRVVLPYLIGAKLASPPIFFMRISFFELPTLRRSSSFMSSPLAAITAIFLRFPIPSLMNGS